MAVFASHRGYAFCECDYSEVVGLVAEADETHALLQRKSDDEPFHRVVDDIFNGQPGYQVFVLVDARSQPVGFTMTVPESDARTLSIGPTFISSRLRGQGLGKTMIQQVIEWARARGIDTMIVATWGGNLVARGTFEAAGFRFVDEELDTRVNGDSTVTYELDLRQAA